MSKKMHENLSVTLRTTRRQRGWSLDRAAAETGVSKAMLGQIERGESSPTVATLWKIATGMRCSLSYFLSPSGDALSEPLARDAQMLQEKPAQDDMLIAPVFAYDPTLGFEVYELTLLPGYERISEPHSTGVVEHILVIQGQMQVLLAGQWQSLGPRQSVRFAADREHGYRNLGAGPCVLHNIIAYPKV